jgi:DMSO/TMAO reductase YedYZ heme-binding membrane subunit
MFILGRLHRLSMNVLIVCNRHYQFLDLHLLVWLVIWIVELLLLVVLRYQTLRPVARTCR